MDTAQPVMAAETDPNAAINDAANAFKAFTGGGEVEQPQRDERGRFAAAEPDETELVEGEPDEGEPEADIEDEQEAAENEPAQPMPPSWPADKAETWAALPADAQEYIVQREAEQTRAIQTKFQEAANARKSAELEQAEVANNRRQLVEAYETVAALLNPVEPDPRAYGAGTGQYNREAYDLAMLEYRQQVGIVQQLQAQRQQLSQEAEAQERQAWNAQKARLEEQFAPKLLEVVPELTDPAKGEPVLRSLIEYAVSNGIPEDVFAPDQQDFITSAQLLILRKAQMYDTLKAQAPAPKPKQAGPVVRPGVSSPRSAQRSAQRSRDYDRLNREGSVEAGAAVFKHFFK